MALTDQRLINGLSHLGNFGKRVAPFPYAVIGSAALAIHLATLGTTDPLTVADIDVVTSADDALRLLQAAGTTPIKPKSNPLFRSAVFGRIDLNDGYPIEVMGGFAVAIDKGGTAQWHHVWPVESQIVTELHSGAAINIATPAALAGLFRLFDRPKDRERLAILTHYFPSL
jgi:hypothetical protein